MPGAALVASILYFGYISHRGFKETVTENFNGQQAMFARSLEYAVRDHLFEKEQDLLHVLREIIRTEPDIAGAIGRLSSLYTDHLESFESIGLFDHQGELLSITPEKERGDQERLDRVRRTIAASSDRKTNFLSESFVDDSGRTALFLLVPFRLSAGGGEAYFAVGALNIEDYMTAHFPAWKGKSMGFVLADADGHILSMLNTSHGTDIEMKRGNLLALETICLGCHQKYDFEDMTQAARSGEVIQSSYLFPGAETATNRTTVSFPVFNKKWAITIFSPFESIQRAIDDNFKVTLSLALLSLLLVGTLSYVIHKALRLEEIAETAGALRKSEERLGRYTKELESANQLKDLFTDIVRHDLLNPVSIVKGYAHILSDGENDPSRKRIIRGIERALHKLTDLIENSATISTLAEIEGLEVRLQNLGEMIINATGTFREAMSEKDLELVTTLGGYYPAIANIVLEDVFSNLVSNAVKYSPEGKKIEVGIRDGKDRWEAFVKDWGEGIPDEHKDKVFTRLERLKKDGIKGTGLGLAIVRRIVDLHGGTVWVEDNPEGGSVFIVSLPKGDPGKGP